MDPNTEIDVLDHGYVKLLNISGPTRRVNAQWDADSIDPANTARISFDEMGSDRTRSQDLKLVRYLIEHFHNTPVEMLEVWLEMKLPIFLARQFVRHRTACINEVSGRYVELPCEFYTPVYLAAKSSSGAKQGRDMRSAYNTIRHNGESDANMALYDYKEQCKAAFELYQQFINDGVAPEQARMVLPLSTYTHWVWKQDLHNMLHMLRLRLDSHAQHEAQQYAQAVLQLLRGAVPEIMDIWMETRKK